MRWAFEAETSEGDGVRVLEFVRDVICRDPDIGETIDTHTRRSVAPGTKVTVIWTFNRDRHYVEIVVPPW